MEEKIYLAALAGLLHDIGKFAQRAGERGSRTWDDQAKRDFKYFHALLTADFIDKYVPEPWRVPVKNIAGSHHRPVQRADRVLALADHLSAGERADPGEDSRAAQPRQLLSIFCSVTADQAKAPQDVYWPLNQLQVSQEAGKKALFPGPALKEDQTWKIYEDLWREFCREAGNLGDAQLENANLESYLESLLLLMQRYTWSMPSAYYKSRPDISLYDHDRITAALSAVLTGSSLSNEQLERLSKSADQSEEELSLLVGGDISGVQDFIYTITARGATSALRGRSFYLQLLTEAVVRYVLHSLDLPITSLIYAGGGNFYLLARASDGPRLIEIQKQVSKILLYHHRGDLYLALSSLPLRGKDFYGGRISQAWGRLAERLQSSKLQRFSELGPDIKYLFAPQGHGGNLEKQCQVCGAEHPDVQEEKKHRLEEGDEKVRKCPQCFSYERLGEDLRQAEYLIFESIPPVDLPAVYAEPVPGDWQQVLACFGLRASLYDSTAALRRSQDALRSVLALSDATLKAMPAHLGSSTVMGRRFLVNVTPLITDQEVTALYAHGVRELPEPGSTKPFHAMEAQSTGIPRLGVLLADIDNLGKLFSEGLGERASLSRVASLSFAISLYFEGWVEVLAAEQNRADAQAGYGERLYSIYSGGDDLFFVGAWDAVVELARRIRSDLTGFAANHPGIHASAGIALVGGKYPLYQAAQDAHRAQEAAKSLQWLDSGVWKKKDAVSFLGQVLPWKKFGLAECNEKNISAAHALMHLLTEDLEPGAQTPLIRRLTSLNASYQEAMEKRRQEGADLNQSGQEQTLWGPWNWLGYYSLRRLSRQRRDKNIEDLVEQLKADDFRSIEWIGLAARWAELYLR